MQLEKVTVFCFFASYVVALALEGAQFLRRSQAVRWGTIGFAAAGLLAQTIYLVVRSRQVELPPLLGSSHDWLLVSAWLVIVLYLGVQIWSRELSLGIFVFPLVLILVGSARFVSQAPNPRIGVAYWWSMVHASLWVFGILGVSLALIVSLMYLVQHYRLKHKRAELPALHLLSLERLSQFNWWLIILSVPLLTLGMITGLWMSYLTGRADQPVDLMSIAFVANAAIWGAMATLFGWLLAAKHPTGRGVAWRTLLACSFLLATLLIVKLLSADGIHGTREGVGSHGEFHHGGTEARRHQRAWNLHRTSPFPREPHSGDELIWIEGRLTCHVQSTIVFCVSPCLRGETHRGEPGWGRAAGLPLFSLHEVKPTRT